MLRGNPEATEFVKTADVLGDNDWLAQPDTAFADSRKREFPILDPQHTAISIMYASKYGASNEVWESLRVAADVYNVDESLFTVVSEKTASVRSEPVAYLLEDLKRYPIYGELSIKQAEEYLYEYGASMHDNAREEFGDNLVKVAEDLGVELRPNTLRRAGRTVTDVKLARDMMFTRCYYAASGEARDAFMKIASVLEGEEEIADSRTQTELVDLLRTLDKRAGLSYSSKLPTPEQTVYNTTKVARRGWAMGPYQLTPEKLARIDTDILGDIIGDDMVDAMCDRGEFNIREASALLGTLPRDIQDAVARTFRL